MRNESTHPDLAVILLDSILVITEMMLVKCCLVLPDHPVAKKAI